MASPDIPDLIARELPDSIEDTLSVIDRQLLSEELRQDPLVQWVYECRELAPLPAMRISRRLPFSQVTNQFINQALLLLIPFYITMLRLIGNSLRSVEVLISQVESALEEDNLEASVHLTELHIATLKDPTPSEALLLKTARESPSVVRDALREILHERLSSYTTRADEIRTCWKQWRNEVGTVKDGVENLQLLAIAIDFGTLPMSLEQLMSTISPALSKPSYLPDQLMNLSLATPLFPNKELNAHIAALAADIKHVMTETRPENNSSLVEYLTANRGALDIPATIAMYRAHVIQANRLGITITSDQGVLIPFQLERQLFRTLCFREAEPLTMSTTLRRWLVDNGSVGKPGFSRRAAATFNASRRESATLVNAILDTIRDILASGENAGLSGYSTLAVSETTASAKTRQQPRAVTNAPAHGVVRFSRSKEFDDTSGDSQRKDDQP